MPNKDMQNKNGIVIDPTANVIALVNLNVKRMDDIREIEQKHIEQMAKEYEEHFKHILEIRERHNEDLRNAEAKRIDAIRAVDVNAVSVASERATQSASVLATQVSASAETLRALVAQSASTTAAQLSQIITPITDRLALLEKAQYERGGKEGITDPMISNLLHEMTATRETIASSNGKSSGTNTAIGWVIGVSGVLVGIIAVASRFFIK